LVIEAQGRKIEVFNAVQNSSFLDGDAIPTCGDVGQELLLTR
jgi:hypothetical protein